LLPPIAKRPPNVARLLITAIMVLTVVATFFSPQPASADTAANKVVTTATTPTQANVAPNGPLTGIHDLDVVQLNLAADGLGTPPSLIFGVDVRLCRSGLNITLTAQFTASSGNCIASALSSGSSSFVTKTFGAPNQSGSANFIVGAGAETVATHVGPGAPIVCGPGNPCSLWLREAVPTGIVSSGSAFVHYDLTYASSSPPGAPTAATATAGIGTANVSWTAPTSTGGSPISGYTVTSSPGGLTCTSATTSCTVSGLDPFTAYTFTVTATNTGGTGLPSAPTAPAVTPGPATAPVITSAVAGNGKVTVTWAASTPAPVSYTVSSKQGTLVGPTCTTATTTCDVTGLTNGLGYKFVVTATYAGGTKVSASTGTVTPKVAADLAASNTVPVSLTAVESITNNGPDSALGVLTITVATANETGISTDPGLTCAAPVADLAGTGFTQVCTTNAPLAPAATLTTTLTLTPKTDPHLTSIRVTDVVSFPVTMPVSNIDSVSTNNKVVKTLKVIDTTDLSSTLTGATSVGRTGTYVATATLSNLSGDPVYAKFTISVNDASEVSFTAAAGLSCAAPVPNGAGTGYSRLCTTTAPLASGASLSAQLTLAPTSSVSIHAMTISASAAKLSGNVVDPVTTNNKSSLKPAITDSVDLATGITAASGSVLRANTISMSGHITNNGPDAGSGKDTITVVGGTIQSVSSDAGLSCVGTGAKTTCTISATVPAGTTLNFTIVVLPSTKLTVTSLSATSTTSVLGGATVTDPNSGNNVFSTGSVSII